MNRMMMTNIISITSTAADQGLVDESVSEHGIAVH